MMMGDEKAKATVDAMMGGFLAGVSKYSLEKGVASSVIAKRRDLVRQVSFVCVAQFSDSDDGEGCTWNTIKSRSKSRND